MKDQVPVVLLNQWLGVEQEKSRFNKKENWLNNSDEYSVYSDSNISRALSINGTSVKRDTNSVKRKSLLQTSGRRISILGRLSDLNKDRRMSLVVRQVWVNLI
jgi:hypothetical protein